MGDVVVTFDEYTRLPEGFRVRPDGRGNLAHVKVGNQMLREIPDRERLVSVVCHSAGSRRQPRLVAVVTVDESVHVVGTPAATAKPGRIFTQCRCGPDGHTVDLARLAAAVARLRPRPAKARQVDVTTVAE